MTLKVDLKGFTVENLRGFTRARLSLERSVTLLVGPNNAGKTSLLRLLEWSLSGVDEDLLLGRRVRTPAEDELLLPARKSRSRARRLTLTVGVADGRRHKKFQVSNGVASLRLRIVGDGVYAAVSPPRRSEPRESETAAIELWSELCASAVSLHVPAARDASSDRFHQTLVSAVRAPLEERGLHEIRGGAPTEYRQLKSAAEGMMEVGEGLVKPLWEALDRALPSGFVQAGRFKFDVSPQALVEWLLTCVDFRISTGQHDSKTVRPQEVGSGLQSLLDLALLEAADGIERERLLLLEEPEAFLHPAAQRQLARDLLSDRSETRVVSTHSPIVVDESRYGQVVLVKDHRLYEPNLGDRRREEINSALMGGRAAEAFFSESVLLVEGPGDWAFFNEARRRLQAVDSSGCAGKLGLISVGGKTRFAPWIRLFQSYVDSHGELPIQWTVVADSIDAATDVRRAFSDASVTIDQDTNAALRRIPSEFKSSHREGVKATHELNTVSARDGVRLHLLPVDLEYSMLSDASQSTRDWIADRLDRPDLSDLAKLLGALGSKHEENDVGDAIKAIWIREEIGRSLSRDEFTPSIRQVLKRWLGGAMSQQDADDLVNGDW